MAASAAPPHRNVVGRLAAEEHALRTQWCVVPTAGQCEQRFAMSAFLCSRAPWRMPLWASFCSRLCACVCMCACVVVVCMCACMLVFGVPCLGMRMCCACAPCRSHCGSTCIARCCALLACRRSAGRIGRHAVVVVSWVASPSRLDRWSLAVRASAQGCSNQRHGSFPWHSRLDLVVVWRSWGCMLWARGGLSVLCFRGFGLGASATLVLCLLAVGGGMWFLLGWFVRFGRIVSVRAVAYGCVGWDRVDSRFALRVPGRGRACLSLVR